MTLIPEWTEKDAAPFIYVPTESDDKYSHGVLGMVTGSKRYPGAAILGVEAAHHAGIGMIRYFGPRSIARLVMVRRPEIVTVDGRVNAWLIGSGIDARHRTWREKRLMLRALHSGLPVVVDAGALDLVTEANGPTVITPHARELARLLTSIKAERSMAYQSVESLTDAIVQNPADWCEYAADELGVVVLLKGHETHIAAPTNDAESRFHVTVTSPTTWLATAGSGDVLAGILGALVATMKSVEIASLGAISATAAWLHGKAATLEEPAQPFPAGEISERVSALVKRRASA